MAERFSLKDHLFNPQTVAQLASEYSNGIEGFDADAYQRAVLDGLASRELLERLDWMADCLEPYLREDFPGMADQLIASMPPALDVEKTDDDFGQFIHAVPGILAVRHGLEDHREKALDLLYEATKRFSMELYIRPFLNRWPDDTLKRLSIWSEDENYHVRRLVSEGTRPRLPWAKSIGLTPPQTLPLLDKLHADPTRYVTRSVANHLNDLTRIVPDDVLAHLQNWKTEGRQGAKELDWMTRHALRTQIKAGAPAALKLLGFDPDAKLDCTLEMPVAAHIGDQLTFAVTLTSEADLPVLVDYILYFATERRPERRKVFKLKQAMLKAGTPLTLEKTHKLKGNATTFSLSPGRHRIEIQANGRIQCKGEFDLLPAKG